MKRFVLLLVFLFGVYAYAQDSRGSITGQVTDPNGAALSFAKVTATSMDTGSISRVTTSAVGFYTVPDLMPGNYTLTVNAPGFKTFDSNGIHLETQQNATINVKLEVGGTTEVIEVNEKTPLITTADASTGQVLTTEEVEDLPSNGQSPLGFARIEYGAVAKAKHDLASTRPMDNSIVSDFSLGGGNSQSNEILLNGIPNMQDSGRVSGFSPLLDSVNEVRVDVFGANVTYGDTSGGTVNITTKSGTNGFHGSANEYYQDGGCSGLNGTFVSRSASNCTWMSALPYTTPVGSNVSSNHYNQYGATFGGPVWIPHFFDGHNKLFFFYAYERYVGELAPSQTIGTVPTAPERTGDFSALLPTVQLYNPYSIVAGGNQTNYTRNPITDNQLFAAGTGLTMSNVAQAYLNMVPPGTYVGPTTKADGENNYFGFSPNITDYRSHMGRIDYNISDKDKVFGEAHRSRNLSEASNYFNTPLTGTNTDTIMAGGLVEEVHTFSQTLFLDTRGSVTRYDLRNAVSSSGTNPSQLGFPAYLSQNTKAAIAIPNIAFSDTSSPLSYGSIAGSLEDFDTIQFFSTLTKIWRSHTFTGGVDLRAYKDSTVPVSTKSPTNGSFTFGNGTGTNEMTSTSSAANPGFGTAFALFMLGLPTKGSQTITPALQYNSFLDSFFVQDDWKARPNITVSAGVRFEHEIPVNESQNRMVNGFDPTANNEAAGPAEAAYLNAPSPLLPAASFLPTGGAIYASSSNRSPYTPASLYVSPRLGVTWAPSILKQKGVVRAGFGIYTNPFNDYDMGQSYGYSATTQLVASADSNFSTHTLINDPFSSTTSPINPIQSPTGNSLGVNQNLGAGMVYYASVKVPYSERFSLDTQYQVGNTILIDIGYLHNHQVHLSYSNAVSSIPLLPYLSTSPYYSIPATNLLTGATYTGGPATTNIANPFLGVTGVTGTMATATLLAPSSFLQTNPVYSGVTEQLIPGSSSKYDALNVRVAKHMGHGLILNGVFEWSRLLGTFNQLNAGGPLNYGETTSDYPFHFAGYGTYQLPFGRGRQFFNQNRIVDGFIGGWQVSAIYEFLSGQPIQWNNVIYLGNGFKDLHNKQHSSANRLGLPVFNTSVFDQAVCQSDPINGVSTVTKCVNNPTLATNNPNVQPNGENFRTFPQYLMRQDYTSNWDGAVQKNITAYRETKIELRLDGFNLLNRPQYNTPTVSPTSATFGETSGVYGGTSARQLQVGAHIVF